MTPNLTPAEKEKRIADEKRLRYLLVDARPKDWQYGNEIVLLAAKLLPGLLSQLSEAEKRAEEAESTDRELQKTIDSQVQELGACWKHLLERDHKLTALQATNQRLADLVRYKRHDLHNEGLISNKEYSEIVQNPGAVNRLEGYDNFLRQITTLQAQLLVVTGERDGIADLFPLAISAAFFPRSLGGPSIATNVKELLVMVADALRKSPITEIRVQRVPTMAVAGEPPADTLEPRKLGFWELIAGGYRHPFDPVAGKPDLCMVCGNSEKDIRHSLPETADAADDPKDLLPAATHKELASQFKALFRPCTAEELEFSNLPPKAAALGEVTKEQEAGSSKEVGRGRSFNLANAFAHEPGCKAPDYSACTCYEIIKAERDQLAREVRAWSDSYHEQVRVSLLFRAEQTARWDKLREEVEALHKKTQYVSNVSVIQGFAACHSEVLALIDSLSKEPAESKENTNG